MARLLSFAGYGAMAAGAYVGGELVFRQGNQVDRHAFDSHSTKWKALDVTDVPAGTLVKAKAGTDTLVLYRATDGDPISALSSVCAHEGGPLDKGEIVDGCVQCPWHGSQFNLADGHVLAGRPSTTSRCSRSARPPTAGSRRDAPRTATDDSTFEAVGGAQEGPVSLPIM